MGDSEQQTTDIAICVATVADSERVLKFLLEFFYPEEPLSIGCEQLEPDERDKQSMLSNLVHGTCLLAVQNDRIVGAAISGPKLPNEAELLCEEAARVTGTKWSKILGILAILERNSNVFARYHIDRALHVHCIGVDSALRGRGVGQRLMHGLCDLGRKLGFPILTGDCTSVYSARLMQRLGFEKINTLRYSDYVDANGQQIVRPPAPHEQIDTVVYKL